MSDRWPIEGALAGEGSGMPLISPRLLKHTGRSGKNSYDSNRKKEECNDLKLTLDI